MCRLINRHKALILWYHGICNDGFDLLKGYDERHIPISLFRKELDYLKRKGYVFLTLSQYIDTLKHKKQSKRVVVLTFDDGFKNIIINAYPVMKEFNAKGCFFLVSSLIGGNKLLWTDYIETIVRNSRGVFEFSFQGQKLHYNLDTPESYHRVMKDIKRKLRTLTDRERLKHIEQFNAKSMEVVPEEFLFASQEQIQSLAKEILEVGSHTRNHPNCTNLVSDDELKNEISDAKTEIERIAGYKVKHFSYPAGAYNNKVKKFVQSCGYDSAVTTIQGFNDGSTDLYELKRISTNENFLMFKAMTSGSYFILARMLELLRRKNG